MRWLPQAHAAMSGCPRPAHSLQVEIMQRELRELQPVLAQTAAEVEAMMAAIARDKEEAAATKAAVQQQEEDATRQAATAKAIAGAHSTRRGA
jgi:hypothetical protein